VRKRPSVGKVWYLVSALSSPCKSFSAQEAHNNPQSNPVSGRSTSHSRTDRVNRFGPIPETSISVAILWQTVLDGTKSNRRRSINEKSKYNGLIEATCSARSPHRTHWAPLRSCRSGGSLPANNQNISEQRNRRPLASAVRLHPPWRPSPPLLAWLVVMIF